MTEHDQFNGDKLSEFVGLLTEHQEALRNFVYSLMPNHPDVRDLVQEVNIVLWEKRSDFQLGTNFGAWARMIARNKVMNHRKKLSRAGWMVFDDRLLDLMIEDEDFPEPDQLAARREALRVCLAGLPPRNAEMLLARYTSREELQRFADRAGRTRDSLRVTLCRLRCALRDCIIRQLKLQGERA